MPGAGELRALRRRIRSVKSTQKITRAMELIAASRITRARNQVEAARPYAQLISRVIRDLATESEVVEHPLLAVHKEVTRVGIVVGHQDVDTGQRVRRELRSSRHGDLRGPERRASAGPPDRRAGDDCLRPSAPFTLCRAVRPAHSHHGSGEASVRFFIAMVSVLISERWQTLDPEMIRVVGIDPGAEKILVVESTIHDRAAFEPLAHAIVEVVARGLSSSNLALFPFDRVRRPIFPLDPI